MSKQTIRPDQRLAMIREALRDLRLPIMAQTLDAALDANALTTDNALEFLWGLLEPQLQHRRQRAVERRIQQAQFREAKSFDDFDFAFQPKLDKSRVMQLATLDFVKQGQNLLIGGMSGTGKSHIAIAIAYLACAAGIRTRYTTSADMLGALHAAHASERLADVLKHFVKPQLLVVDELGLDITERERTHDAHLFYKVIAPRYERARSVIITSNIAWDGWGKYLGDDIATVAILDRLIHHGHLLDVSGPSYRAAQHAKLNDAAIPMRSTKSTKPTKPTGD